MRDSGGDSRFHHVVCPCWRPAVRRLQPQQQAKMLEPIATISDACIVPARYQARESVVQSTQVYILAMMQVQPFDRLLYMSNWVEGLVIELAELVEMAGMFLSSF